MKAPHAIYCDGGVCGKNPSKIGGTWAWCWVNEDDCLIGHDSGFVTPGMMKTKSVTNNQTELLAAVTALASVGLFKGWSGTLYTDSLVTLYRVTDGVSFNAVPGWLEERARLIREGRKYRVKLVAGHPTRKELLSGVRLRNGLPVSHWNAFCDKLCREAAEAYLKSRPC